MLDTSEKAFIVGVACVIIMLIMTLFMGGCCNTIIGTGLTLEGSYPVVYARANTALPITPTLEATMLGNSTLVGTGLQVSRPRFSIGIATCVFDPGDHGPDLHNWLEFHSYFELKFSRFGLGIDHISNAGLGSRNPGANFLRATIDF